jgi:formylmethanofuran--tetrahydromethanopterin N-formyltransferase
MKINGVSIVDTFAEAFESHYSRFLITAKTEKWVEIAAREVTGFGSSIIGCSAEVGVETYLSAAETPDGRPGAVVQIWTGKKKMLHELLDRIGQCVLTAPTTAVFDWCGECEKVDVGRKMRYFGDGYAKKTNVSGRRMYAIPIMMGEFLIERDIGFSKGVAGGNFLIMGSNLDSSLSAAEAAADEIEGIEGVISSFPGGICASGSKVGSNKYEFMKATTSELFCPSLRDEIPGSMVPEGVGSIAEVVLNGVSRGAVALAMKLGIEAATMVEGIKQISAANYGGNLGNVHIKLYDLWR